MKKKLVLFIVVMMFFAFSVPSAVYAEDVVDDEEQIFPYALQDISKHKIEDSDTLRARAAVTLKEYDETQLLFELEDKIKEALLAGENEIDILDMGIDSNKYNMEQINYFSPYLSNGIDVDLYYAPSSGAYTYIALTNKMTVEETNEHFEDIDSAVCELTGKVLYGMTDEEKALVIHDYFADQYAYDYDNYLADTIPEDSFRSGGLFKNETGVCQAYAYGYKYIMSMLEVECYVTSSSEMNHAWNIIKIGEVYYHVDCTYDDPARDRIGQVSHRHFLLSDDIMEHERKHSGWDLEEILPCNSTNYDNAYWQDVSSPIILKDANSYYVRWTSQGNYVCKRDKESGTEERIAELGRWNVWNQSSSSWQGAFSGLFIEGSDIYYNTSSEIRKISLDEEDSLVYKPGEELKSGYIYGLRKKGTNVEYLIMDSPNEENCTYRKTFTVPITFGEQEVTGILLNKQRLQLEEGGQFEFEYTLTPQGMTSEITWSTSDAKVAKIENDGTLTARSAGNATITATTDNGKTSSCQVTVIRKPVPITGVTLDPKTMSLEEGETGSLVATIIPSDTTESRDLIWSTSNQGVATVENGTVTAVAAGEATITVTASNGMRAECKVTVTGEHVAEKPITGISLNNSQLTLEEGSNSTLTATIEPEDTTASKELTWSTSNQGVATVENGTVTAIAAGEAIITVSAGGKSAECKVTVTKKAEDNQLPFTDVASDGWYTAAVEYVYTKGIMTGYASNTSSFGPGNRLTRAEFVTILSRVEEAEPVVDYDPAAFPDVADKQFYTQSAIWAKGIGVVTGYTHNGCFGPADDISREQIATMMYRYAEYLKLDMSLKGDLSSFPDAGNISGYAKEALEWAVGNGLITGKADKYIDPQGKTERSECATIIMRFMEKYNL